MDEQDAAQKLDSIQRGKQPVQILICGASAIMLPLDDGQFKFLLSMANKGAMEAAYRLNDIGADIKSWPPKGYCEANCTRDTTLYNLMIPGDLEFKP